MRSISAPKVRDISLLSTDGAAGSGPRGTASSEMEMNPPPWRPRRTDPGGHPQATSLLEPLAAIARCESSGIGGPAGDSPERQGRVAVRPPAINRRSQHH